MAYVKREGEKDIAVERHEFTCADKVRGLGTQWIGTEGAMDAAKKDWMERVRYDYGESFLDMNNAKDFVSRCGRVSIGETMGQVMYRCEIVARPCKGTMAETKPPRSKRTASTMRGGPGPSVRLGIFGWLKPYGQNERFLPTSLSPSRRRPP